MDLKKELNDCNVILVSSSKYDPKISLNLAFQLEKSAQRVGYISVEETYNSVKERLTKDSIRTDNFFFGSGSI
jgi:K+-transporting ATPase c subunit